MAETRYTRCGICNCECGMVVQTTPGRLLTVRGDPEDPHNRGGLCIKGKRSPWTLASPDRLTRPLIRWKKHRAPAAASWDDALDFIADRLTAIQKRHGPQALGVYYGSSPNALARIFFDALAHLYGTPNTCGTWSLCVGPKVLGYQSVFGPVPSMARPDYSRARTMILWGANPAATHMHRYLRLWPDILAARKRGGRLAVIDPRPSKTARAADLHLPIRPGTDRLLAVSLIKMLLDSERIDPPPAGVDGLDALTGALARFDSRAAISRTGLAYGAVEELVRWMTEAGPAVVDRREGAIHQIRGAQLNRAIAVINALIGAVDRPGGLVFGAEPALNTRLGIDPPATPPLWHNTFPWAKDAAALFLPAMERGQPAPIRGLIACCGNPVSAWPNTARTRAALADLDLLVVDDLFMTETAQLADVVLPGAAFFEKGDLSSGPFRLNGWLRATEAVAPPPGEARPEWRTAADIARRLGYDQLDGFETEDDAIRRVFQDSGLARLDPSDLRRGRTLNPNPAGRFSACGFPTTSGRMSLFEDAGRRPEFHGWLEPDDDCPVSGQYPLRLITGARVPGYYHSQQRTDPVLKRTAPAPAADISPELAEKLGVRDGTIITVVTATGRMELPARIRPGQESTTVSVPHGWPGLENVNYLVAADELEPLAATPAYRARPCRVEVPEPLV